MLQDQGAAQDQEDELEELQARLEKRAVSVRSTAIDPPDWFDMRVMQQQRDKRLRSLRKRKLNRNWISPRFHR